MSISYKKLLNFGILKMIRAIFAADEKNGIGKNGKLPWPHNSQDLQWFKEMTVGSTIVMGRKTWDSLPKKPLPNRYNIVVTNSENNIEDGPSICTDWYNVRKMLPLMTGDVWIIGGAEILKLAMPICEEIYISRIKGEFD